MLVGGHAGFHLPCIFSIFFSHYSFFFPFCSSYLEKAEGIDPNYCDVNYQFAHCHVQQGKYLEFEQRLTHALLCPFTMGQAIPLWQNYWKQVTSDPRSGAEAKVRMDKYQAILNEAIEKEQRIEDDEEQRRKPQAFMYDADEL